MQRREIAYDPAENGVLKERNVSGLCGPMLAAPHLLSGSTSKNMQKHFIRTGDRQACGVPLSSPCRGRSALGRGRTARHVSCRTGGSLTSTTSRLCCVRREPRSFRWESTVELQLPACLWYSSLHKSTPPGIRCSLPVLRLDP